ncbi:MAG: PAS domain S-box protein, partial [Rhodothermales bacterium]|nr:PAS domain S-box protein [Rhodothermales bacterium]
MCRSMVAQGKTALISVSMRCDSAARSDGSSSSRPSTVCSSTLFMSSSMKTREAASPFSAFDSQNEMSGRRLRRCRNGNSIGVISDMGRLFSMWLSVPKRKIITGVALKPLMLPRGVLDCSPSSVGFLRMDIVLVEATRADAGEVSAEFGDMLSVHEWEEGGRSDWPLALLFLENVEDPAGLTATIRKRCGPLTLLVGLGSPQSLPVGDFIAAGLDDVEPTVAQLATRMPFLLERVRQRARRHLRLEAILENTVDGILVIDSRGTVQSVNRAVESIFGYSPDEVVGENVSMLMPSPDRERHDKYLTNYLESGKPRIIGIGREVSGRRKDGSTFPLDLAVSEVRLDGQVLFAGIIRDISDRRRLETEVLRVSEEERRRIGRDMHDGLGQMLTGIGLIANNVARKLEREGASAAEEVAEIADLV